MTRTWLLLLPAMFLLLPVPAAGDEEPALREVLLLNQALQKATRQAEPSIACILVSRSDAYRKRLDDAPSADEPGRLGPFPPRRPGFPGDRLLRPDEMKKLDLADPDNVPEAYGSGVVLDEKGLILTNYHVVRDATKVFVRLPGERASYADIHAADPRSDLAVLRLLDERALPVPALPLGDGGAVEKGQWVLSLANPFAAGFRDGSPSVSWGIISNVRRRAPAASGKEDERRRTLHHYGTLLQTDARLNLGVSGGALINLKGELIGLTTALAALSGSETAGGFAVPLDAGMRRIVDVLRRGEEVEYGFLGVELNPDARRGRGGVQVRNVTPGSPAFLAGIQPGDTILSVNGTPVYENDDLFLALGTLLAGSEARLEIRASPRAPSRTVTALLAKFYVPGKVIASKRPTPVRGLRVDYTSVLMMQNATTGGFRAPTGVQPGVAIREVLPSSPAAMARLREGEVITHVNDQPVLTPADFHRLASRVAATAPLELTLAPADWSKPPPKVTLN